MKLVFAFALSCVVANLAFAAPLDKIALIGKWDYTSYTLLHNGHPSGTINFKPGALSFIYNNDGSWAMEAYDATHTKLNGSYEIHGAELIMRKADGSPYQDFKVETKDHGKIVLFIDKGCIVTAIKIETAP